MKVYGNTLSGSTRLVLMALAEKKVEYEFVSLDFAKGEHKQAAHVARQPFGKVPAIEHDGFTLFESRAIARYVNETFPGPSLLPSDPKKRALVHQWACTEQVEFFPVAHFLGFELAIKPMIGLGDPDPGRVETLRAGFATVLAVFDRALEGKNYLVGEEFTLADMVYMPDLELLHMAGEGARIAKFDNVARWWKTISSRPAWQHVKTLR